MRMYDFNWILIWLYMEILLPSDTFVFVKSLVGVFLSRCSWPWELLWWRKGKRNASLPQAPKEMESASVQDSQRDCSSSALVTVGGVVSPIPLEGLRLWKKMEYIQPYVMNVIQHQTGLLHIIRIRIMMMFLCNMKCCINDFIKI